jgi:hypothetical protein
MLISPDGKMGWNVTYNYPYGDGDEVTWQELAKILDGTLASKPFVRKGDTWERSTGPDLFIDWNRRETRPKNAYVVVQDMLEPIWAYQLKKEPWSGEPFLKPEELTSSGENDAFPETATAEEAPEDPDAAFNHYKEMASRTKYLKLSPKEGEVLREYFKDPEASIKTLSFKTGVSQSYISTVLSNFKSRRAKILDGTALQKK